MLKNSVGEGAEGGRVGKFGLLEAENGICWVFLNPPQPSLTFYPLQYFLTLNLHPTLLSAF